MDRDVQRECTATKKNGTKCNRYAIRGGNVCRLHGGAAPQVIRCAQERLAALVDPAIGVLQQAMKQKKDLRVRLSAAQDVLDRNNLSGKQKIEVGVAGWAAILREKQAARAAKAAEKQPG